MAFGTLYTLDLLRNTNTTIQDIGEDNAWMAINDALTAHNALLADMVGSLMDVTTDRQRVYGGNDEAVMEEIDEFGTPDAQKVTAGATVGFPLRRTAAAVQWTRHFFARVSAQQLAAQFDAILAADRRMQQRELKRALFRSTNYTFNDRLAGRAEDRIDLSVKRLVNADSMAIPMGPSGVSFTASTHTHYLGTGSFVAADLTALIETVVEHYATGMAKVYINRAQEVAVSGFVGFVAYNYPGVVPANNAVSSNRTIDPFNLYDRAIGTYRGAEIVVKPWVPASYVLCFMDGAPKPLVMRVPNVGPRGLNLEADEESHPLRARVLAHEFGIGVWNRTNGAVLYTGNATYADPTLN